MKILISVCGAIFVTVASWGGDFISQKKVRSLPPEMAALLKDTYKSDQFSCVWKANDFVPKGGYRLAGFKIESDDRNGRLFSQLRQSLETESDPSSTNELHLVVVYYLQGKGEFWIELEGLIKQDGKNVGAFLSRYSQSRGDPPMTEVFMSDLTNFLK